MRANRLHQPYSDALLRHVDGGTVRGATVGNIDSWRGIPYAAPPTGMRRFRAPDSVQPWQGVRDATHFGPIAVQAGRSLLAGAASVGSAAEDCLTINVQAPHGLAGTAHPLPVMVFIHGGGYSAGSSRDFSGQGEGFIRDGGVIYVSFNYRLGALGYLDFTRYSTHRRPLERNLGLRDQIAALTWVRNNIDVFGGDPGNVTVFGESAGANAVTTLMTAPSAGGLFARAIAQSSPPDAVYSPDLTREWAAEFVEILAGQLRIPLGRDDTDAVNALLTRSDALSLVRACLVLQAQTPETYPGLFCLAPVVDGDVLPEPSLAAFRAGRAHRIPLIIGTNEREGSIFHGRIDILPHSPRRIRALFEDAPESARPTMRAAYPALPARRDADDFGGDYGFWYPSTRVADFHSRFADVWAYRFDFAPALVKLVGLNATHGLEMFALFDRVDVPLARAMTSIGGRSAYSAAGARMRTNWIGFARDGKPADSWPSYTETDRLTWIIDATDRVEHDPRSARRVAWDAFLPRLAG